MYWHSGYIPLPQIHQRSKVLRERKENQNQIRNSPADFGPAHRELKSSRWVINTVPETLKRGAFP